MSFKFENLNVWKLSRKFVSEIYSLTRKFPQEELFGLTNQIRRAAVSVMLNIAEGSHRRSDPEFKRFLTIARSSIDEVVTGLYIASDQKFITSEEFDYFYKICDNIAAKITALMNKLNSSRQQ